MSDVETSRSKPFATGERRVCAVVVTYRPGSDVPENIAALAAQVDRVFVIDNEVTAESQAVLAGVLTDPKISLVTNATNRGIAAAMNQGAALARAEKFSWLATFDQDSRVGEEFIAGLLVAEAAWPERSRVALITPVYRDQRLGFVYSASAPLQPEMHVRTVSVAASSGNLVSLRAHEEVGGFREDFFIDCVDFEFCLRCRRQGWQVLETSAVVLAHAQGHWTQRRLLWKNPRVNDYSATRRYYQARNRLIMAAEFVSFDPAWVIRDGWGYCWDVLKLILFCEDRLPKLGAVLQGGWHAVSGRRGAR